MTRPFSHRGARSTPLVVTLAFLVAVESAGVHALLFRRLPWVAVTSSALGILALAWLVADHRALGSLASTVGEEAIELRVGRRLRATIPRALVVSAIAPTWRDLPAAPEPGYVNATKPAEPNVLLTLREPVVAVLPGGLKKPVRRIALSVDAPEAFLVAVETPATTMA